MYCLIITTFTNKALAKKIASALVEHKLAACVNLSKKKSFYRWKGKKICSKEIKMEIKTRQSRYRQLEKYLCAHHEFETPQMIKLPIIGGLSTYFDWIDQSLS